MTKYKTDELYLPPSDSFPEAKKASKRAWEENAPTEADNRTFYPEFYKFALLFKIIGFFPVHLTKRSSDLRFSWFGVSTLFSVLTFPLAHVFIVYMFPVQSFNQFFSYFSVLTPLCTNLLYIYKLPTYIKLIQLMDSIDTNYCLKPGESKETRKNNNFVVGFVILSIFVGTFPIHLLNFGFRSNVINGYFSKIHPVVLNFMHPCLIYVVCYQLLVLYDRYHASLASLEELPCNEVSEQMVEDHRLVHAQLVRCVRLLDRSFGIWLMVAYVRTSYTFVNTCYSVMYGSSPLISTVVVLNVSSSLFFIFYPAVLTDRLYNKSKDTIHFTFRMAMKPYSADVLFQIYYFMRQVKINVAAVSAGGLADVNKEIITKALSLFATFFIATIQLEPQMELLKNSFREWIDDTYNKQDDMW